jgi:hypothetical protein
MKRKIGLGVLCLMVAAVAPLFARASAPNDWVLATMTVTGAAPKLNEGSGSSGGSFGIGTDSGSMARLQLSGRGHQTGSGPTLLGFGDAFGSSHFVLVFDAANGGVRLQSSKDLGSVDIEITPADGGTFGFSISTGALSTKTMPLSVLFFATNAVIDSYSMSSSNGSDAHVTAGAGSRVIQVADPDASGVAVDTGIVAAGASTVERTLQKGIVGGLSWGCTHCDVSWTTSDQRDGSFTMTSVPFPSVPVPVPIPIPFPIPTGIAQGDSTFVGPAGTWSWSWTGANVRADSPSPTAIGAYAPVGDFYSLFGEAKPLDNVIVAPPHGDVGPKPKVKAEKQTRTLANTGLERSGGGPVLIVAAGVLAGWLGWTRRRSARRAP